MLPLIHALLAVHLVFALTLVVFAIEGNYVITAFAPNLALLLPQCDSVRDSRFYTSHFLIMFKQKIYMYIYIYQPKQLASIFY